MIWVSSEKLVLICICLICFCIVTGCISTKPQYQSYKAEVPPEITDLIIIGKFTFNPEMMVVTPGTTVTWVNEDDVSLTIESAPDSKEKFKSEKITKGEYFSHIFNQRGTFSYYCVEHPSMTGTIIVQT